jgi:hypothetical protein
VKQRLFALPMFTSHITSRLRAQACLATRTIMSNASADHRVGDAFRVKGLSLTDHFFTVPLDHSGNTRRDETIEVFVREVVSLDNADPAKRKDLPCLVYLQGGPGFESPRPTEIGGWLAKATESFRVLLLDQRGTGRSTRVSAASVLRRGDPAQQTQYLAHFRADSIVADCEQIRTSLLGESGKWSLLGQVVAFFLFRSCGGWWWWGAVAPVWFMHPLTQFQLLSHLSLTRSPSAGFALWRICLRHQVESRRRF